MAHDGKSLEELGRHNTARFFTENRHVSWVLLIAVVVWGIYGYLNIPQRKDPDIPVRLAVAIPLRSAGASIFRCFLAAVATSLTQPLATIPAVLLAWFFTPLMPVLMGFAAGAMIFLVVLELIPEALETESPKRIAWAFIVGFCLMLAVQVVL